MQVSHKVADIFSVHKLVSLKQLFKHRAHYGHKEGCLNPYMAPYVYGTRLGVSIIDLNQTVVKFRQALNVAAHIAYRGGVIMFASNHKETGQLVENTAIACGEYAHCRPYNPRTFTDSEKYFGNVMRLPDLIIMTCTLNTVFLEHQLIRDSAAMLIPTIAIVDTNCDPRLVSYPIPANDDTPCAINLYCNMFKEAILAGKAKKKQELEQTGKAEQVNN